MSQTLKEKKTSKQLLKELLKRVEELEKQDRHAKPYYFSPLPDNKTYSDCMHDNCPECKAGTCSGVHMIACPCRKCSPYL